MTAVVTTEHLAKRFHAGGETREILKDVSLRVPPQSSLAIMGPSGSGKTTLLNIIGTLDTPTSGTVSVCGLLPFTLSEAELARFRNSSIGFVFQSHHLLPQCSVLENVLLPAVLNSGVQGSGFGVQGVGKALTAGTEAGATMEGAQMRAVRLLDRVGLKARMNDRPARLSGGECQRAALVRALINRPKLLLADEPTGNLDRASADNIAKLLVELRAEEGLALIVVTHTNELAGKMERIVQLRDGELSGE
ncbi:MAG TPA: ABC transporter ATP-binding protein [Planctomycetota bacterium]|jgi:lipoprotein-releasing system ATP-binding protein